MKISDVDFRKRFQEAIGGQMKLVRDGVITRDEALDRIRQEPYVTDAEPNPNHAFGIRVNFNVDWVTENVAAPA